MLRLLYQCLLWSFFGRLLRSFFKTILILKESLNDYLSYLETVWHYDSPRFFKTLYFNLRVCNFKQAYKCPVFLYGETRIWSLKGKIYFEREKIQPGLVKWGYDWGYRSNGVTIIRIEGDIYFKGSCLFAKATDIAVFKDAKLSIGDNGKILENSLIYCAKTITIGSNFSFTFQSSMMDTDFHYMMDVEASRVLKRSESIVIGDNVWVGNRATVKKGVRIPDNTIIAASYTLLTKDYTQIPPYSILGGCPAKVLSSGYARVWKDEIKNIALFDRYFNENPDEAYLQLDEIKRFDYIYECK